MLVLVRAIIAGPRVVDYVDTTATNDVEDERPKEFDMPAYFETGFSVRQPMWHGEGEILEDYPESWDAARLAAGLMWEPVKAPVYDAPRIVEQGVEIPADWVVLDADAGDGNMRVLPTIDGYTAVKRDDTMMTLGVPTSSWEPITHAQMGDLCEAFTEAWTKVGATVHFETAGSIDEGRKTWALVWLDEPYTIPGDDSETYPFAAMLNDHTGKGSAKLLPTQVRVVCWNTWNAASAAGDRTGHQVIIRHTGNVADRIEQAKEGLRAMRDEVKDWQMLAADLAGINIDDAVVRTFLEQFIPTPENATDRTRNSRAERQATFMRLYNDSPTVAPLPDTAYKLTQAAGEYLDHLRPYRHRDTYLARTMFRPEPIKAGVIKLVRDIAQDLVPA